MSKEELIDSRVSLKQCRQAVEALHSHELKKKEKFEETQLLPGKDQYIWLNVTIKQIPANHKLKPVKIPIVHPLVDPRTSSVCLLTKDPQREYKDLLETHQIKFISRVVGVAKLKGKFKAYEARRMLLKENGLFLADDRIIPLLPKLLGSKWFEAKKQPIPVCLTRKDLKGELERAISSTYMNQNRGTCTSIKIGKMSQTPAHILENLQTALPAVAKAIKGGWDNIQNFAIKTNSSVSLPIWSCTLDVTENGVWNGLQVKDVEDEDKDSEDDSEEEEEEVDLVKEQVSGKGRKRVTNSDELVEEEEKPRKKSKAADGTHLMVASPLKISKLTSTGVVPSLGKRKSTEIVASPPKKHKQGKTPVTAQDVVSSPETLVVPEPTTNKRKSQGLPSFARRSLASAKPDIPSKKTKPVSSTVAKDDPSPSRTSAKGADTAGSATISKRQKRSASNTGEKKKRIMLMSKGGKSAKNAVLGRIVGQE